MSTALRESPPRRRAPARLKPWQRVGLPGDPPFRRATALATLVLVFSFPWQGTLGFPLSKLIGYGCIGLGILAVLVEGRRSKPLEVHALAGAFAIWAFLSSRWTVDAGLTATAGLAAVQLVALLLLVHEFLPGREGAIQVAGAYVAGCTVLIAQITYLQLSGQPLVDGRLTVGAVQPNDLAYMLCLGIPLAWHLSLKLRVPLLRRACQAFPVVALYAVVLTGSRAGLLTGLLGAVLIPWTLVAGNPRRGVALLLAAALAIPLVIPRLPSQQVDRLASTKTELVGGSLNNRTTLWAAAWKGWGDHALVGVGAGASRIEIEKRAGVRLGAHNTFLDVALDLGAVGLALFCLIGLCAMRRGLRTRGADRRLVIVLGLVLIVGLQVRHWEYEKPLWTMLAILVGLEGSEGTTSPLAEEGAR